MWQIIFSFLLLSLPLSPARTQRVFKLNKYLSNRVGDVWQYKNFVRDGLSPIIIKTSQEVNYNGAGVVRRAENNGDYRLQRVTDEGLKIYRLYFVGERFVDYEKPVLLMPARLKIGET